MTKESKPVVHGGFRVLDDTTGDTIFSISIRSETMTRTCREMTDLWQRYDQVDGYRCVMDRNVDLLMTPTQAG